MANNLFLERLIRFFIASHQILTSILSAAKNGQTLPILTILLLLHTIAHIFLLSSPTSNNIPSLLLLSINLLLNILGYTLLYHLTRHSIRNIFNRNLPTDSSFAVFKTHLSLLKPLEITWRYLTARFRVLPDIIVLGEVRCGTTTVCQHLRSIEGCHVPFCLWKHPELDEKETFYFVGHYLNHVSPSHYRMCFPLQLTKWIHTTLLNKPFFTFDGCAQYLTSPTAPYLIARAYRMANQPPPVLVACVRDPVDQAISWWRYEHQAVLWGERMGLTSWNTSLRTPSYPPKSISDALQFSISTRVQTLYETAERMVSSSSCECDKLPDWAMTWPGGQFTGIGRNGRYCSNLERYERVLCSNVVHDNNNNNNNNNKDETRTTTLKCVTVIPIETLNDSNAMQRTLSCLIQKIWMRSRKTTQQQPDREAFHRMMLSLENRMRRNDGSVVHRNKDVPTTMNDWNERRRDVTPNDKAVLASYFKTEVEKLERACGTKFGWMSSSKRLDDRSGGLLLLLNEEKKMD